jgi:RNA polymerase sigma-70 factor, ECF subfamily
LKSSDDITLFRQITNNHKSAFDELFRRYYIPLCNYALKICLSGEHAEEAVQSVFIYLWEHRTRLDIQQSVASYLYKSVRLKIYENYRSQQTKAKYEEIFSLNQELTEDTNSQEIDSYELSCLIWSAVDQLPEKCGEIFRLSRDEGLTYNEIAEHLHISVKTVENQMGIAFKKLREILYPLLKSRGWDYNRLSSILLLWCFGSIVPISQMVSVNNN